MTFMVSEIYNRRMADFIEFIDVYKSFGERQILNGVSFKVETGRNLRHSRTQRDRKNRHADSRRRTAEARLRTHHCGRAGHHRYE